MKIAIMQPYFFPYIGYFQLIHAVDEFVFLDDVNFIKKGYINRNSIICNGNRFTFTVPLKKVSQNKLINETELAIDKKWVDNFLKTVEHSYKNSLNFKEVYGLLTLILKKDFKTISDLAMFSIKSVSQYLDITTNFKISSCDFESCLGFKKANKLI